MGLGESEELRWVIGANATDGLGWDKLTYIVCRKSQSSLKYL